MVVVVGLLAAAVALAPEGTKKCVGQSGHECHRRQRGRGTGEEALVSQWCSFVHSHMLLHVLNLN